MRHADVRIVAATHRDLAAAVADGSFREDLYYRLKGVVLTTPKLDDRGADKALLAQIFLRRISHQTSFSPDALAWIAQRPWPGNVRELRAAVECAVALAQGQLSRHRILPSPREPASLSIPSPNRGRWKRKWQRWSADALWKHWNAPATITPIPRANWAFRASGCSRRWIAWGCGEVAQNGDVRELFRDRRKLAFMPLCLNR
jgi:DNA-binding NtrC family response regulator